MKCWWTMLMPRAIASAGPADRDGLAVEQDLTLVGRRQPVEDVHQGRLAGAVLAEQRVDLARPDVEVDPVVGDDARIALGDPAHLERGGGHGLGHGGLRLRRRSDGATGVQGGSHHNVPLERARGGPATASRRVALGCVERRLGAAHRALDGRARIERPVDEARERGVDQPPGSQA